MFNALNIKTDEILATAKTREAAAAAAEKLVGRFGYCVRPVAAAPAEEFFSIDSGIHRTRLLDGRIIA
jgi:hypothetical protein